ncbi:VTC domain-containing protein [Dactylosporangium sp. NPDC049140]|uniref:VTC domain-containing protein n=1 Tax=Dactylosporangium sp. NPDC049140 TaxID=3155647 RepID=UPI003402F680
MTALDVLEPVRLEELQTRAALLTRADRKYVLPEDLVPDLLRRLPAGARVLQIGERRRFGYCSEYLDTPGLDAYLGAARRRRGRFKVRVRTYLDSGDRFTEVKTRGPRGVTVKHRTPYAGPEAAGRYAAAVLGRGVLLGAALVTCYQRVTLYLPASASRVTIDTGLSFALPGGPALALPGRAVVETKTPHAAGEVDRLLWRLGHRPGPISKYATGLAALRPDLPANRWRPVLRRHFPRQESR